MRYSEIKDIESLDKARRILSRRIERKGDEVLYHWDELKESYSPMGLLAAGLRSISLSIPFDMLLLRGIRFLRKKI